MIRTSVNCSINFFELDPFVLSLYAEVRYLIEHLFRSLKNIFSTNKQHLILIEKFDPNRRSGAGAGSGTGGGGAGRAGAARGRDACTYVTTEAPKRRERVSNRAAAPHA